MKIFREALLLSLAALALGSCSEDNPWANGRGKGGIDLKLSAMSVITLGIIALCVYTRNTWKTIFIIIIYMLMDSLICNTSIFFLKKLWIGYYLNLWLFSYEYLGIPLKEAIEGIAIIAMYGIFFYHTSLSKMKKMDL